MKGLLWFAAFLLTVLASRPAEAFCGFYVSGGDQKLYNNATLVTLMREGQRTVLSMQNNYQGPPERFAMVVPVPHVLQKENVRTLPRDVFDKIEQLSAPRLVEYWEQDPCSQRRQALEEAAQFGMIGMLGTIGFGGAGDSVVRVEARFEVGEYEIVILGASDSMGLYRWLQGQGYHIPDGAEPVLRPYVNAGMKFFVAKVDPTKVRFENGQAMLSPLRFHYDTDTFSLPVRLGLLNSAGAQDLIVHILAKAQRYELANYSNVTIPTNLDVAEGARARFGEFYAALFDATVASHPRAAVTEYAWSAGSCDPCPSPTLDASDLATLGGDVLDPATRDGGAAVAPGAVQAVLRSGKLDVKGALPPEVIQRIVRQNFGRFRVCYQSGLQNNPQLAGDVAVRLLIDRFGAVALAADAGSTLPDASVVSCIARAMTSLTFPEPENGTVRVVYRLSLGTSQGVAMAPGWGSSWGMSPGDVVLTRLHVRYGADTLGDDLVFRAASPIVGGREVRDSHGDLEHGALPAQDNNFQARYAIRHGWVGPLACADPVHGVWGGPPNGVSPQTEVAQKLAFAPRGRLELASLLQGGVPELALLPSPASAPAATPSAGTPPSGDSASPPPPARHAGCTTAPWPPGAPTGAPALVVVAVAASIRRRRGVIVRALVRA